MPVSGLCYAARMQEKQFEGFGVWLIIGLAVWAMAILGVLVQVL